MNQRPGEDRDTGTPGWGLSHAARRGACALAAACAWLSAGAAPAAAPAEAPQEAPTALVRLIAALEPAPAYVLGPRWEFLAWNAAQERLYPRIAELDGIERNLLWVLFADPFTRQLIVDWDIHARQALAEFRAGAAALRGDPAFHQLVDTISTASPDFARWWAEHEVTAFETRIRRFRHPHAGELTFEYQQLAPVEWPGLRVVVQLPVPGDDSAQRLAVKRWLV